MPEKKDLNYNIPVYVNVTRMSRMGEGKKVELQILVN